MYARDIAAIATPIGLVRLHGAEEVIEAITIVAEGEEIASDDAVLREGIRQIAAYFDRRLTTFDLPLTVSPTPRGGALRAAIVEIGYGETASYGALAAAVGSSARAVGQACARNPFPIIVPCHRVLAANGVLGAYSAGDGPRTKRWLLDMERAQGGLF